MSDSINLFKIGIGEYREFTIRWYPDKIPFGHRLLGDGRHAFDTPWLTFLFENYNPKRSRTKYHG